VGFGTKIKNKRFPISNLDTFTKKQWLQSMEAGPGWCMVMKRLFVMSLFSALCQMSSGFSLCSLDNQDGDNAYSSTREIPPRREGQRARKALRVVGSLRARCWA
jgi:hypothetical protein